MCVSLLSSVSFVHAIRGPARPASASQGHLRLCSPARFPHPALEDRCGNCITHLAFSTARHICLSGYAKTSTRLQVQEHRLLSSL